MPRKIQIMTKESELEKRLKENFTPCNNSNKIITEDENKNNKNNPWKINTLKKNLSEDITKSEPSEKYGYAFAYTIPTAYDELKRVINDYKLKAIEYVPTSVGDYISENFSDYRHWDEKLFIDIASYYNYVFNIIKLDKDTITDDMKDLFEMYIEEYNQKKIMNDIIKQANLEKVKKNLQEMSKNIPQTKDEKYEMVNHPTHYNNYDKEVIEMMNDIWGPEETAIFCKLNAFKYRLRMGTKPGNDIQQDLNKEKWYLKKFHELKILKSAK